MKARFLLAAAAALAMVSCSKTEQAGITSMESDGPVPVSFTSYTGRTLTKANASLNQSFNVAAFQSGLTPYVYYFSPTVYKYTGGGYVADTVRYWPKTGGLDFYAVSPTAYKRTDTATDTLLKVSADTTITVTKTDGATDIVADSLMKVANGTEPVALKFGHKLTKVAFKAKGADSLLSYIVKGISVKANSTGKYHFGEPGKWDGGKDAYDYIYISETTKDTIPAGQSGAKAMGTAKYLIPAQGDKVEATVSYSVYYGKSLLEENTDVAVSLPVTDVWGVNQSVVYTLTLSVSAKKVSFTAEVVDWDADIDTPLIVKDVYSFDKDTVSVTKGSTATVTLRLGTAAVPDAKTSDFTFSGTTSGLSVTDVTTAGLVTLTATAAATATADAKLLYKKNGTGAELAAVPVKVTAPLYLPGLFTVNSTDTKVHFSKGNLYWDGSAFKFEANQYSSAISWDTKHVSHFYWSKTASVAYAESYSETGSENDVFFTNSTQTEPKSDFTVAGETGVWRTLSGGDSGEWEWLLGPLTSPNPGTNCRTSSTVGETANARYAKAKVNDVTGLLIFPDVFTWTAQMGTVPSNCNAPDTEWDAVPTYTVAQFSAMESAGCVFLPAAGRRDGSYVDYVGDDGYYWSSTANDADLAYYLAFFTTNVDPADVSGRNYGCSVRLVSDVK